MKAITRVVFEIERVLFTCVRYIGIEKLRIKPVATEMGGVSVYVRVTHKCTRAVCKKTADKNKDDDEEDTSYNNSQMKFPTGMPSYHGESGSLGVANLGLM